MKILEDHWPDITTYKRSGDEELDQVEASLKAGAEINALWVDVPSNPLLLTPDMPRICRLANEYHFLVLIDGTVGTFVNVDLLPYGDVLMASLTKIYSGYANLSQMNGRLTRTSKCCCQPPIVPLQKSAQKIDHILREYIFPGRRCSPLRKFPKLHTSS